jgi:hypothetical protein
MPQDHSLKTIRDLRQCHLAMLQDVYGTVSVFLQSRHKHKYYMYFHYMPSVFQLHLHVNSNTQHINWDRAHLLSVVTSNLRKDSEYYAKALILTKMCKTIRSANAHMKLKTKLPSLWMHCNHNSMCTYHTLRNSTYVENYNTSCPKQTQYSS